MSNTLSPRELEKLFDIISSNSEYLNKRIVKELATTHPKLVIDAAEDPHEIDRSICNKIENEGFVQAIKWYRGYSGKNIKDAKDRVDSVKAKYNVLSKHECERVVY